MLRVTLDTNIYVSGLNCRGKPYRTLELAREGKILVAVSDEMLDEVERVLQEKFHCPTVVRSRPGVISEILRSTLRQLTP